MKLLNVIFVILSFYFGVPLYGMERDDIGYAELIAAGQELRFRGPVIRFRGPEKPLTQDDFNKRLFDVLNSEYNDQESLEDVIKRGADINARDVYGNSALGVAALNGNVRAVSFLIRNRAKLNVPDALGRTPLLNALFSPLQDFNSNLTIVDWLIKAGADVKVKDKDSNSLFHYAARSGNFIAIPTLIKAGLNINDTNNQGETPLHIAALKNIPDKYTLINIVPELIKAGANIHAKNNNGKTPLELALLNYQRKKRFDSDLVELKLLRKQGMSFDYAQRLVLLYVVRPLITAVSLEDIQHVIPTIITLTSSLRGPKDLPFPRDVGKIIVQKTLQAIIDEKIAFARQYLPGAFSEDELRKAIMQNIDRAIKKSPQIEPGAQSIWNTIYNWLLSASADKYF